jgi:hypothetical protein
MNALIVPSKDNRPSGQGYVLFESEEAQLEALKVRHVQADSSPQSSFTCSRGPSFMMAGLIDPESCRVGTSGSGNHSKAVATPQLPRDHHWLSRDIRRRHGYFWHVYQAGNAATSVLQASIRSTLA